MDELLQFLIAGLKNGSIYALVALGFTIIFAATGAINFAQGEFFMLGGMLGVFFAGLGLPLPLAAAAAVAATAAIGAVFELLAVRPIKGGDPLRIIMVTIGGAVLLRQMALHLFGPDELPLEPFTDGPSLKLLGAAVERQTVWIWVLTGLAVVALALLYRRTAFGRAMRATSIQRDAARLVGVNAQAMVTASFALAAALGAVAGLAVAPLTQAAFHVGAGMGVKGFAAASSAASAIRWRPSAAVCCSGSSRASRRGYIDPIYKDAVALVVLLVVLFVRPQGLFGGSGRMKM